MIMRVSLDFLSFHGLAEQQILMSTHPGESDKVLLNNEADKTLLRSPIEIEVSYIVHVSVLCNPQRYVTQKMSLFRKKHETFITSKINDNSIVTDGREKVLCVTKYKSR